MKSRGSVASWVLVAALAGAGCGGDDDGAAAPDGGSGGPNHVADPEPAAGGGVSHGAVNGELNVFVLDSRTKQPLAGATVQVGTRSGTTAATGLTTFSDASLVGAQDIAVSAAGHVPTSWFGANGAVVTITMDPTAAPAAPETATVSGSLTLPRPTSAGHATAALVLYSFTKDLDAPENHIVQPDRPPCVVLALGSASCDWSLTTRTGRQSHYAVIVDVDPHGTPNDATDDTYAVLGFAAKSGIDLSAGQTVTNEQLTMLDTVDFQVAFPASAPTGLGIINSVPLLVLGDERVVVPVPLTPPGSTTTKLPALAGPFAGGSWTLFTQAKKAKSADDPQSSTFVRAVDPTTALTLPAFPALPTALVASGGSYTFTGVAGASLHAAEIDGADGAPLWQALVLDDTRSLTIAQAPDPLPPGALTLKVSALRLSAFDPGNFAIDANALADSLDALSSDVLPFTR